MMWRGDSDCVWSEGRGSEPDRSPSPLPQLTGQLCLARRQLDPRFRFCTSFRHDNFMVSS